MERRALEQPYPTSQAYRKFSLTEMFFRPREEPTAVTMREKNTPSAINEDFFSLTLNCYPACTMYVTRTTLPTNRPSCVYSLFKQSPLDTQPPSPRLFLYLQGLAHHPSIVRKGRVRGGVRHLDPASYVRGPRDNAQGSKTQELIVCSRCCLERFLSSSHGPASRLKSIPSVVTKPPHKL